MNEAAMAALEEKLTSTEKTTATVAVKAIHFEVALSKICPSVSAMVCSILPLLNLYPSVDYSN